MLIPSAKPICFPYPYCPSIIEREETLEPFQLLILEGSKDFRGSALSITGGQ